MVSCVPDGSLETWMLIVAILAVLLIVTFWRMCGKIEELEYMRGDRDCWINTAAECRRDGGAGLRSCHGLNLGVAETLDKADKAHAKGYAYTHDTGCKYVDE